MRKTLRLKLSQLFDSLKKNDHSEELTRFWLLRGIGFLYFCAFFPLLFQFKPLLGSNGLLPLAHHLQKAPSYLGGLNPFWNIPTVFWFNDSDSFGMALIFLGSFLSLFVLMGSANLVILLALWIIQLSIYHVGQTFWGFGWEMNLLELGFLALFLVPIFKPSPFSTKLPPPKIILFFFRLVLFKVMLGSGLIKIRGDNCWTNLECLSYHFETQPIPGPLSPFFHNLPKAILKGGVFFNHVVELILPWFIFFKGTPRKLAGFIFILFQVILILSGNYGWINYLTLVMIIPCLDDSILKKITPRFILEKVKNKNSLEEKENSYFSIQITISIIILYLSIKPIKNLIGPRQIMNTSYDQFALVNTYGLFGGVTKKRFEIIIKGTADKNISKQTKWKEYSIPCKPGLPSKRPCMVSPYHYRLAWQIWFAAIDKNRIQPWLVHLMYKILLNKVEAVSLLEDNPFQKKPPTYIKMDLYLYKFYDSEKDGGLNKKLWYTRKFIKSYLPPLHKSHPQLQNFIKNKGWSLN